jgi:hypothetical protein
MDFERNYLVKTFSKQLIIARTQPKMACRNKVFHFVDDFINPLIKYLFLKATPSLKSKLIINCMINLINSTDLDWQYEILT